MQTVWMNDKEIIINDFLIDTSCTFPWVWKRKQFFFTSLTRIVSDVYYVNPTFRNIWNSVKSICIFIIFLFILHFNPSLMFFYSPIITHSFLWPCHTSLSWQKLIKYCSQYVHMLPVISSVMYCARKCQTQTKFIIRKFVKNAFVCTTLCCPRFWLPIICQNQTKIYI